MHLAALFGIFIALSLPTPTVGGTIYKCKDANGDIVFGPAPCADERASSASRAAAASSAEGIADRAAISKISGECIWRAWSINDRADTEIRQADTARLRLEVATSARNSTDSETHDGIVEQLAAAEDRKAATLSVQRIDLKHLRRDCDKQRTAELKRQTDRDAARATTP